MYFFRFGLAGKLGSPVGPFCPFSFWVPFLKPNSSKKGTLIIKGLLGNSVNHPKLRNEISLLESKLRLAAIKGGAFVSLLETEGSVGIRDGVERVQLKGVVGSYARFL